LCFKTGMHGKRTMDELEKRAKKLELLVNLGQRLNAERDFDRLLRRIWMELTEVLDAERSSLFLLDEETGEIYSVIAQQEEQIRIPRGKGIVGNVAETGESLLIGDAYSDPRFNSDVDKKTGFTTKSILSVPLTNTRGVVLGVCQVLNRQDGKPFNLDDQLLLQALAGMAGTAIETLRLAKEQKQAAEAVIIALVTALEMRVPAEQMHSIEVRAYSRALAKQLRLQEQEVRRIEWAAALHDIGKLAVPDEILNKTAPLSEEELEIYKKHAEYTHDILSAMEFGGELSGVEDIAPYHHKKFGGGGYPVGPPHGPSIPLGSRIIAVADTLWAQTNTRFGVPGQSIQQALSYIESRSSTDFDPLVVQALSATAPQLEDLREAALMKNEKKQEPV